VADVAHFLHQKVYNTLRSGIEIADSKLLTGDKRQVRRTSTALENATLAIHQRAISRASAAGMIRRPFNRNSCSPAALGSAAAAAPLLQKKILSQLR